MNPRNQNNLTSNHGGSNSIDAATVWAEIAKFLEKTLSSDAYSRWFTGVFCGSISETEVMIYVPTDMHLVWIETNFMPELQTAISAVLDPSLKAQLSVGDFEDIDNDLSDKALPSMSKSEITSLEKKARNAGLNPKFKFDSFVVGNNSEFAHAASCGVASGSGIAYNPLFIHGSSGLGKTHLMHAIGHEMLGRKPDAKIFYITSEKFTNEFIEAVKKGSLDKFRKKYRRADLLLIDDIQFIAGKERTEEEFFHTFNTLLDLQSQIVMTSDRPACEIKKFDSRMISRFESGLTVELQIPLMETRMAILKKKVEEWGADVSDEILRLLADRIRSNVRRLEGALVRVATFSSLGGSNITIERVEHLLKDILREEGARKVTIDSIQKSVSDHYDIRLADMSSRRRPANIAFARQIAMYLSRKLTQCSLMEIGDAFGGRDHGTVIHAVKKVEKQIDTDRSVRDTVDLLDAMLQRR